MTEHIYWRSEHEFVVQYTPTTELVRARYAIGHGGLSDDAEDVRAEAFDRWMRGVEKAAYERGRDDERERIAVAIEASDLDSVEHFTASDGYPSVAVLSGAEIRAHAARIAREKGSDDGAHRYWNTGPGSEKPTWPDDKKGSDDE